MEYKSPDSYQNQISNEIGICLGKQGFKPVDVVRNWKTIHQIVDEVAIACLCYDRLFCKHSLFTRTTEDKK